MTSTKEIAERFNNIEECVKNDDAMMLAILLRMYGDTRGIWDIIHEDITCLAQIENIDPENTEHFEECLESLESSFDAVMNEITERELLDNEPISKLS